MGMLPSNSRIAVIAGGFTYEQDSITKSTQHVLAALSELEYLADCFRPPFDIGLFRSFDPLTSLIIDPYFVNEAGDTYDIRYVLDDLGYRYTGSNPYAAAICRDKALSKKYFSAAAVRIPRHFRIDRETELTSIERALRSFSFPVILKPVFEGSGVGVHLCSDSQIFGERLATERQRFGSLLLEDYILGIDTTVMVMGHGENIFALVPVEIELRTSPIYDYDTKRGDAEVQHVPARHHANILDKLRHAAVAIHRAIGCRGLSRVDFRVHGQEIWCVEINASSTLGKYGNLPRAWRFEKGAYSLLIDHLLQDALED
jgi:D-alanine-D-alanine ligase